MTDDTKLFSKTLAASITGVGLLITAMISLQLFLGVLTFDYYPPSLIFVYVSNLLIVPTLLFLATKYAQFKLPMLIWLHISMGIMITYFSQTYSPFTTAWSILVLITATYYSWRGFILSCSALFVISLVYILVFTWRIDEQYDSVLNYSLLSVLVVALTIFLSYMFVAVIARSNKKNRDLTKTQRSERLQINRLNTLLNSISDAVLTLNRYGRVTSQNAAAQAFFDTNESLIGRDIDKLLHLNDEYEKTVTVRSIVDAVKSTLLRDDLSYHANEEVRHLSIQVSQIRSTYDDNEEYGVVMIIRDITKQKSLEEEKDEFISVTSHELRTPVAIAEGSLSNFLLMRERGVEEKKINEAAEEAHKQIIYLSRMINDLSTLSRAERGVGDIIEEIDVNAMLHDLYLRYTPEAATKSLILNLDAEPNLPTVETSRLYLEEMLQNFITNSIKYTKEGSVTVGAKMSEDDKIEFFVKDSGIGMSKTDVQHIFEKFYRSEDYRTRETSGTGLGLYVVSKLASKLNTRIKVESRLNHGSTFSFALSLKTVKFGGKTTQAPTGVEANSEKKKEVATA